jgi:hypothetical protein
MSWFRNVQEILWVLAPKLVFFSLIIDTFSTSRVGVPLALELLLDGILQLDQLNWV